MRGGKRIGSGVKPGPHGKKIDKNIALTADVWGFLISSGTSAGMSIETMVRKTTGFKNWSKQNADIQ